MDRVVDTEFRQRFAADWTAVWPSDAPVGIAVSGGPDSLALLLLALAVAPGPVFAATVDHGLRPESAAEAAAVAAICAERGVRHAILRLDMPAGAAVQERARAARYAALGDWGAAQGLAAIATAHHADDQAETLLMRLGRGAGVRGLSAMRAVSLVPGRPGCALLRPLLCWRRSDLARVVAEASLSPVDDPANRDPRFERARLRAHLAGVSWLDAAAVAASASHLAEADAAIDWAAERALTTVVQKGPTLCWPPEDTPRAVSLRVLERIVAQLGGGVPRGKALASWHDRLVAGEIATLSGVRGDGRAAVWRFRLAPAPRGSSPGGFKQSP